MAAPEKNQFWKLRAKHGRDRLFESPQLLWEAASEYFEYCDSNPFYKIEQKKGNTIISKNSIENLTDNQLKEISSPLVELPEYVIYKYEGLCLYLGCGIHYFDQFESSLEGKYDEISKDFSAVLTRIRLIIRDNQLTGGVYNALNPMLIARMNNVKERTDITSNDKDIQGIGNIVITREDYKAIGNTIDKDV